ncbi:potassium transporter TrkH [Longibacter salinarum]|uniref:Potassium transporter TrkH n=1 Tax=Longibacter salinarum TaxID=1850348 RepID=A0A2A8CT88_9BACT|nr:TrkH family potassium uptake protein [Longibacter salinarum]PEN10960.1 potassium transporter TrkH [Longibacter salinarum]
MSDAPLEEDADTPHFSSGEASPEDESPSSSSKGDGKSVWGLDSAPAATTSFDRSVPESDRQRDWKKKIRDRWRAVTPPQLFVGSFLLLIFLGAAGFMYLPGLYTGPGLSWLDAIFTATSAVCVTGLIVVDTATYFTTWGQAYILLLIQLGGLGIISFTSIIIVALGQRLSLRHETLATGPSSIVRSIDYRDLTRAVFRFTFGIEAIGALGLYAAWVPELGWGGALWPSIFHSISAFCNAGFSTFTTSLMGFQLNVPLILVVSLLIVVGGIGFLTLEELYLWKRGKRPEGGRFRLSIHSQIVLGTSLVLIVGGWILFTFFEWNNTLANMPSWARVTNGLFASVTTRTAGFNTIDYSDARAHTNFLTIIFMAIGGSPGSTAGGLKTTTFAVLFLVAWARLRGHMTVSVSNRSIPSETVQKAVGMFVIGLAVLALSIFMLTIFEMKGVGEDVSHGTFLAVMFEAVSAFNTVGLSMGVTDALTTPGRWTTIVLMFIGRVGPLTLAAAMARPRKTIVGNFRYAHEDVAIG